MNTNAALNEVRKVMDAAASKKRHRRWPGLSWYISSVVLSFVSFLLGLYVAGGVGYDLGLEFEQVTREIAFDLGRSPSEIRELISQTIK